jgi:hypothetical protein
MTQNFDGKPSMHNSAFPGGYSSQPAYPSSVPMSVFRELSAELQATRIMLESLNTQNQQLVQHNQRLRQEIGRMVHAAVQVQQVADLYQPAKITMPDISYINVEFGTDAYLPNVVKQPSHVVKQPSSPRKTAHTVDLSRTAKYPGEPIVEQEDGRYRRPKPIPKSKSDLTGLWLILLILGIVVTAFAAGFWIVRPFLND